MSFENISKIYSKNSKNITYLFDVPSKEDEDALISFLFIIDKENNKYTIQRLVNINDFIEDLRCYRAKEVNQNSKEYLSFISKLYMYIKQNQDKDFINEELSLISDNYIEEKKNILKMRNLI